MKGKVDLKVPHLSRHKFYKWSRRLLDSKASRVILCAGNQVGKSTAMAIRNIDWITDIEGKKDRWSSDVKANSFLYLYSDKGTMASELKSVWRPLLLMDGKCKSSYLYAKMGDDFIDFPNVGSRIYFRLHDFAEDVVPGRYDHITIDEEPRLSLQCIKVLMECPYFVCGYTPVLRHGVMSKILCTPGLFSKVESIRVSLYECLKYEDGDDATPWDRDDILRFEGKLASGEEVQRRVYASLLGEASFG